MSESYKELLDQLVSQEISTIEVSKEDFLAFREAWAEHPARTQIVGEAHLGGDVTYRWQAGGADLTEEIE